MEPLQPGRTAGESDSQGAVLTEPTSPPAEPGKRSSNKIIMIVVGVILVCCGCLAALLVLQSLLENSDFTLVRTLTGLV